MDTRRRTLFILLLFGTSCAGTDVKNVVGVPSRPLALSPHTITLIVDEDKSIPQTEDAEILLKDLQGSLTNRLKKRGLVVLPAGQASDLVLECRVLGQLFGNGAARLLIGYGAGKATLDMRVRLIDPRDMHRYPLLSFDTDSTTGSMPGAGVNFLVSGGGTLATASAGGGVATGLQRGTTQEVRQTTDSIDEQIQSYFKSQKWTYGPNPKKDPWWHFW